jgi:serine/threonine protein kinase
MATVVRACVAGFDVAAKITPTRYMSNDEKAELRNTLMLAATLQHRNIVRQLGFNLSAAHEWIEYTELCDKSLDEHIRKAPVTVDTVHQALQVAQALHYMHSKGLMHRDVKSKNVLVRFIDGEAVMKLSDCGEIAVIVAGSSYRTGVGTPEFMAPEVVAVATVRFRAYGSPCDIWSYGMLLFELLTGGGVPYSDISRWQLGETIAAGVRPTLPLKTDRSGSTAEAQLIELFVDCTRVRPAERLTAGAVCARLEKLLKLLS